MDGSSLCRLLPSICNGLPSSRAIGLSLLYVFPFKFGEWVSFVELFVIFGGILDRCFLRLVEGGVSITFIWVVTHLGFSSDRITTVLALLSFLSCDLFGLMVLVALIVLIFSFDVTVLPLLSHFVFNRKHSPTTIPQRNVPAMMVMMMGSNFSLETWVVT